MADDSSEIKMAIPETVLLLLLFTFIYLYVENIIKKIDNMVKVTVKLTKTKKTTTTTTTKHYNSDNKKIKQNKTK